MGRLLIALLALSSSCLSSVLAADGVKTLDGFLDESSRMALLQEVSSRHLAEGNAGGRPSVPVDRSLFAKLRSLLSPSEACDEAVEGSPVGLVPSKRSLSGYGLHKDHLPDGSLVDGMVGVVYLEGQGTMVFTHDHTGTEHAVDVQPGRMIAWDNRLFTHKLVAPLNGPPRSMLGPMAAAGSRLLPVGAPPQLPACSEGGFPSGATCKPKVTVKRLRLVSGNPLNGTGIPNTIKLELTIANAFLDVVSGAVARLMFPLDIIQIITPAVSFSDDLQADKEVIIRLPDLLPKSSTVFTTTLAPYTNNARSYGKIIVMSKVQVDKTVAYGPAVTFSIRTLPA